jgi:hypothetical protein
MYIHRINGIDPHGFGARVAALIAPPIQQTARLHILDIYRPRSALNQPMLLSFAVGGKQTNARNFHRPIRCTLQDNRALWHPQGYHDLVLFFTAVPSMFNGKQASLIGGHL